MPFKKPKVTKLETTAPTRTSSRLSQSPVKNAVAHQKTDMQASEEVNNCLTEDQVSIITAELTEEVSNVEESDIEKSKENLIAKDICETNASQAETLTPEKVNLNQNVSLPTGN